MTLPYNTSGAEPQPRTASCNGSKGNDLSHLAERLPQAKMGNSASSIREPYPDFKAYVQQPWRSARAMELDALGGELFSFARTQSG
jgi:hypothetical protein